MRWALPVLVACWTTGIAAQRRVLRVAPSGAPYTQITDAIAAANPGDTILVATGTYQPIDLRKGLSILAEPGATPLIEGWSKVQNVPAGTTVVLAGLTFRSRLWAQNQLDYYALAAAIEGFLCLSSCRVESGPLTLPHYRGHTVW
jgi:hypothetical protein